jgi:hypothetical protein
VLRFVKPEDLSYQRGLSKAADLPCAKFPLQLEDFVYSDSSFLQAATRRRPRLLFVVRHASTDHKFLKHSEIYCRMHYACESRLLGLLRHALFLSLLSIPILSGTTPSHRVTEQFHTTAQYFFNSMFKYNFNFEDRIIYIQIGHLKTKFSSNIGLRSWSMT